SLKGDPGETGQSAYEVALTNGFTGTEREWLDSLKGDPGKDAAVKIENITGTDGDVLQYKNGEWIAAPIEGETDKLEILSTAGDVQDNKDSGKLVDALVIKQVFQFVSEGKKTIALAITDKGVDTSATDSFAQMAEKIKSIQGGHGMGEGAVAKKIVNISMPIPEGTLQINDVNIGLDAGIFPVVRSCEKVVIPVMEG
ncbi:MAG TPA: hypothetical protein DDY31_12125, partial [Lachnospiraceae bacterium]|nr:hypothetical protein [Lachnospiraceae bacterium]